MPAVTFFACGPLSKHNEPGHALLISDPDPLDDDVLRGGEVRLARGSGMDSTHSLQPALIEWRVAPNGHVDLQAGCRVDDVEPAPLPDGFADHVRADAVVIRGKGRQEKRDLLLEDVGHDVDVVGEARFP
jgi:hypothetical protein